MGKLAELVATGEISTEELAMAPELIERARFVQDGIEACKKNIRFRMGETQVECYSYTDAFGEYHSWGTCNTKGFFICSSNLEKDHIVGIIKITNPMAVFLGLDDEELGPDLKRFLGQQINKANDHHDENM